MKNGSMIPVYDLLSHKPGADFIIKTAECVHMPSHMMKPHRHSGYAINLLLEGDIEYFADFKKHTVIAPALMFLSPDQVYQNICGSMYKKVHISFNKDFLVNEVQGVLSCWEYMFSQEVIPVKDEATLEELQTYVRLMQQEFDSAKPQKNLVLRNLLNAFIICAARLMNCKTRIVQMDSSQNKIVRQFKTLTDENYLHRTQVAQYADMLYVTPGHLNDLIKSVTGKTAKQIIDEKRIVEAKRLLFWGEHSVKEIAGHLNFEDDSYFNRFFKKHTGQTPAFFQKNNREKYN
jgi:AraC family transcriptional regulator, transcriptional activator of pobA